MKIFYSEVARQPNQLRLTLSDAGFTLEQALIPNGESEAPDRLPAEFDPALTYTIKFSEIAARTDFSDHAAYNLASGGRVRPIFNFWKSTLAARLTGEEFARSAGFNSAACLIIPFKDSPVSDWVLGLHVRSQNMLALVNASATAHPVDAVGGLGSLRENMSPSIEFDTSEATVSPDGLLTLGYRVLNSQGNTHDRNAEIYFDSTGGYLPLSRIVTNGHGVVIVKAQHLLAGQRFKVKAGFKYYLGKAECLVEVA